MERIDPGGLYDERGEVSWSRPIFQGDVFADVVLPGFGDKPGLVQVVAHPCAMRRGLDLLSRITVAPVEPYQVVEGEHWNGHLRVMPLADLVDGKHYATKFVDVTAAPSDLLTYPRRVATLSNRGIYVLQQRLVKHYTRLEVERSLSCDVVLPPCSRRPNNNETGSRPYLTRTNGVSRLSLRNTERSTSG